MCAEAPDTSGQQELARTTATLSKEQLDWAKQIYAETAPDRAAVATRANVVSDAQLASMSLQDSIARDYEAYQKGTFRPLEQKMAADALGYDTAARRESEAGQAMSDVGSAGDSARATAMREMAARGVDPSSGNTAIALSRGSVAQGAAQAAAANEARKKVETIGAAKLADAANLGRNIASSQATTASLALNAGTSSAVNAAASLQPGQQAQAGLSSAYGAARQGYGQAAGIYGDIARTEAGVDAGNSAGLGAAGSAIGMVGIAI